MKRKKRTVAAFAAERRTPNMSTIRMSTIERLVLTGDDARALFRALYRPSKADVAEQKNGWNG